MPTSAAASSPARLVIAASEQSADIVYPTKFWAPDAFLLLVQNGRSTIMLSDLEVDRGRKQARADEIVSISEFSEARENKKVLGKNPAYGKVVAQFLKSRRVRRAEVPADFPLGLAETLRREGVALKPVTNGNFWPARERKTPEELAHLRRALKITAAGIARAAEVLSAAEPGKKNVLNWGGATLTSERLRSEIDLAVLRAGGQPGDTIVAGGEQACDPHERGSGPLRGGELIILDIFPRDAESGYFGDMTRTVVRGRASEAQRKLWTTVLAGQKMALDQLRAGADGVKIHESIKKFFKAEGFPTEKRNGRWVGFFHGTGHGLGLDLHESPRYNK
ncbi:MAG: aminopeptidase P family protein, partial [Verrucomicrobia bacterium]|nr:aminopeptidase P family protein [Verrucomicrobiota bacterium]